MGSYLPSASPLWLGLLGAVGVWCGIPEVAAALGLGQRTAPVTARGPLRATSVLEELILRGAAVCAPVLRALRRARDTLKQPEGGCARLDG